MSLERFFGTMTVCNGLHICASLKEFNIVNKMSSHLYLHHSFHRIWKNTFSLNKCIDISICSTTQKCAHFWWPNLCLVGKNRTAMIVIAQPCAYLLFHDESLTIKALTQNTLEICKALLGHENSYGFFVLIPKSFHDKLWTVLFPMAVSGTSAVFHDIVYSCMLYVLFRDS